MAVLLTIMFYKVVQQHMEGAVGLFHVFNVFSHVFIFYVGLLIVRLCFMTDTVLFTD